MDDLGQNLNLTSGSNDDLFSMLNGDLGDLAKTQSQNDLGGLDLGGDLGGDLNGLDLGSDLGGLDLSGFDLDLASLDPNGTLPHPGPTMTSPVDLDLDKMLKDIGLSFEDFDLSDDLAADPDLPTLAYSVLAAYIVVIAVGVGGNLLVIMAVFMKSTMRNSHNFFIVSLALSDLFLCTVTLPITFWEIYCENFSWPFGETLILCRLVLSVKVVPLFMSSMSIATIAYDRYRSVVLNDR